LHEPNLDLLDTIAYWSFRAALLVVFVMWLVRHVSHEIRALSAALREARSVVRLQRKDRTSKVIPSSSF
jgi:hypothetical protein